MTDESNLDLNVIRTALRDAGIDPDRTEWTDELKIKRDTFIYGTGFGRRRDDGTLEHIPADRMVMFTLEDRTPKAWTLPVASGKVT